MINVMNCLVSPGIITYEMDNLLDGKICIGSENHQKVRMGGHSLQRLCNGNNSGVARRWN